jgi:chromate transporter
LPRDAPFPFRLNRAVSATPEIELRSSVGTVFRVFLRLGVTSFGGPVAHIGFFHDEFVKRRRWLDEAAYVDLVALCQFLPGPASSQMGFALGLRRAGWLGALAAWAGFTLPSAVLMIGFALGLARFGPLAHTGWLHGLQLAAVAVVAQAVGAMGQRLCQGRVRPLLALLATLAVLAWPTPWSQVLVIGGAGLLGCWWFRSTEPMALATPVPPLPTRPATVLFGIFVILLLGLPLGARLWPAAWLQLFDSFYRAGALVFGGGHVVLPLLQSAVVTSGQLTPDEFLAGYGVAQALPGPLFTFAAYLGAKLPQAPNGWLGGLWGLVAVFLPGLLLVSGALPWWERLRHAPGLRAALAGANAAVVGVLLAALISPLATGTLLHPRDWILAAAAFAGLQWAKLPPWALVALCALAAQVTG